MGIIMAIGMSLVILSLIGLASTLIQQSDAKAEACNKYNMTLMLGVNNYCLSNDGITHPIYLKCGGWFIISCEAIFLKIPVEC